MVHVSLDDLHALIFSGEWVDKDHIINTVTTDFLRRNDLESMPRDELVTKLFALVNPWIILARNCGKRAYKYQNLTTDQVALILLTRHRAVRAHASATPADWHVLPDQDTPHPDGTVVAVWTAYPPHTWGIRGTVTAQRGYYTSALTINALARHYRPGLTIAQTGRIRTRLQTWAPLVEEPLTTQAEVHP